MKNNVFILYDDTEDYLKLGETRQFLFDNYAEEENWACLENISDERVYEEIDLENRETWRDVEYTLTSLFTKHNYLMTGTFGGWMGKQEGGKFIKSFSDFISVISHLDTVKITDQNGHLIVEGYHHDGSDCYELKELTDKGDELASNYYYAHDRELHRKIMNNNLLSRLPRIAEKVYGL